MQRPSRNRAMAPPSRWRTAGRHAIALVLLLAPAADGSPAEARRIQKTWSVRMEAWVLETRGATTPEAKAKAAANRPDPTPAAKEMWQAIGSQLDQEWTIEPAAWFLRATAALIATQPDGSTLPAFARETEAIRKALETHHLKSAKLTPMCMALVQNPDPRSLAILEKIAAENPDPGTQGVAALAAAMVLKSLGDDAEIMRKRLTHLRKAIIQSSNVEIGGVTVAKLAEDELYVIRFLTKGRVAPDLAGTDSGGRPIGLSALKGKVVLLLFWSSAMPEADRVLQITRETVTKFDGRPIEVIGVNLDPLAKLRSLEADGTVTWKNFADAAGQLANEYRVANPPVVFVLDGERRIHFVGTPGSFAELTAEALLAETTKPAAE